MGAELFNADGWTHMTKLIVKVKGLPLQATKALRAGRDIALPNFKTSALKMGVGGQHQAPAALPPGKTRYPLYRRLGGPQGRSGRVRKISSPPGFDPRTFQPVASRYTDWAKLIVTFPNSSKSLNNL